MVLVGVLKRGARAFPWLAAALCAPLVAGCTGGSKPTDDDPYEGLNRRAHAFDKAVDRAIIAPAAKAYVAVTPAVLRQGVNNLAGTLALPQDVANNLLQLRGAEAGHNFVRLMVNATFGIGGLFDVAGALGIEGSPTDFGQTLYVWGMGEGPYLEVPLIGPTTARGLLGTGVDFAANPLNLALSKEQRLVSAGVQGASRLSKRAAHQQTIDSILYDSTDSYEQTRLIYLQNLHFELEKIGAKTNGFTQEIEDPYEGLYEKADER